MTRRTFRTPGRLIPSASRGLRARAVRLSTGGVMDWHTTGEREELLLGLRGRVRVEIDAGRAVRQIPLTAGESVFLPRRIRHRVVNASPRASVYLYVTGPAC